ncbi:MAG: hypothetical protein AAFP92_07990 [Bacteroidota bacterium]
MKKLNGFLLGLLLMLSGQSFAGDYSSSRVLLNDPEVQIVSSQAGKFNLTVLQTEKEAVRIFILDTEDEILYQGWVRNQRSFTRSFDFSQVPQGTYKMVIAGKGWKKEEQVTVSRPALPIAELQVKKWHDDKKFLLTSTERGADMTVKIYGQTGRILFEEELKLDKEGRRLMDLGKLKEREVTFELISGKAYYRQVFNL